MGDRSNYPPKLINQLNQPTNCCNPDSAQDLRQFTFEPPFVGRKALRAYPVSRLCVSPELLVLFTGKNVSIDGYTPLNRLLISLVQVLRS